MDREKCIELIDSLMDSISFQFINLPGDLDFLWDETPYGGPVFYKVSFLCNSMLRVYDLLQDYQINEWWKDDASRLEKDELNLGTLLQANQLTRVDRSVKLNRAFKVGSSREPLLECVQDLNTLACQKAKEKDIVTYLDQCYTLLANTLIDTYHAEHPELGTLNMLKAKQITPLKKKVLSQEDFTQTMLFAVDMTNVLSFNFNTSIEIYDTLDVFINLVNCTTFQLDGFLTNPILKHNDELVRNPILRERNKLGLQMLFEESQKGQQKLDIMRRDLYEMYASNLGFFQDINHSIKEKRKQEIQGKLEDLKKSRQFFEVYYVTFRVFCEFLKAMAEGKDLRAFMEQDPYVKEMFYTDLKSLVNELL